MNQATEQDRQATKAQVKLAQSAGELKESAQDQTESADRRTVLAADRTVLAAERTYAAWVRTGLAALASGIGAQPLLEHIVAEWLIMATGSLLIGFSAFCFVAAVWREMAPGAPPPVPDTKKIPASILIGVNGFLVLVSLAALGGLWTAR
jgi:putative membrane protein